MRRTAALKILYNFLKERNKIGIFSYYITCDKYGGPNTYNINKVLRRIEETSKERKTERQFLFKQLIGTMISGKLHFKRDHIYDIYRDWVVYVDENWVEIDNTYLQNKEKYNDGKDIQNAQCW